jgi:hypothetical protein
VPHTSDALFEHLGDPVRLGSVAGAVLAVVDRAAAGPVGFGGVGAMIEQRRTISGDPISAA